MPSNKTGSSRRSFFKKAAVATAGFGASGFVTNDDYEAVAQNVNTSSSPSALKITDLRTVTIHGRHIIRIDTNQGVYGYGEVRDGSSKTYALMLKSRIIGMNPCNVDKIFRKLKQFGGHARQSGGPVAIEEACWDIAGKVWGVPAWQMLGGKFRDKIRMYADTPFRTDPAETGKQLKARIDKGFTFLKVDFGIGMLSNVEGGLSYAKGGDADGIDPNQQWNTNRSGMTPHPFTGIRITEKGLDIMEAWVRGVRDTVGWEIPIASDHYGHAVIEDQIKMVQRIDKYNLAWIEDAVPWQYPEQLKRLKESCTTPILTGEDIYLKEDFKKLCEMGAVSMIHPDLATSGGLLETKKIGDMAQEYGVSMAMHMAGNFVTWMSSVHCAAATENFLVMEHHNPDDQWYEDIFKGPSKPTMKDDGFVPVPDGPGLSVEMNEDVVKGMLKDPKNEYFAPTTEWDNERSHDRLWSMNIHKDGRQA